MKILKKAWNIDKINKAINKWDNIEKNISDFIDNYVNIINLSILFLIFLTFWIIYLNFYYDCNTLISYIYYKNIACTMAFILLIDFASLIYFFIIIYDVIISTTKFWIIEYKLTYLQSFKIIYIIIISKCKAGTIFTLLIIYI